MKQIAVLVDQAETVMERFCRVIAFISMAVIFVVLTLNVFARYLGVERLQVGSEIPEVLFPWLVASSVGLAAIHGAHISILLLADRASERVMQFVGTAMSLVTISLYLLGLSIVMDLMPIVKDDKSPMLGISLGWTYAAIGVSFLSIIINQFASLCRIWGFSKRKPPEHIDSKQAVG
jgi:TRAP-type C4-dicarboxylate transport system permease small subunit